MAVIVGTGSHLIGEWILGITAVEPIELMIFQAPGSIDINTQMSDLVETTLPGYSRKTLSPSVWGETGGTDVATFRYDPVVFNFTTSSIGQDIYGYGVVAKTSQTLLWADMFEQFPLVVPITGARLEIYPEFDTSNCFV